MLSTSLVGPHTRVSLTRTKYLATVYTNGAMAEFTMVNGLTTKCTEKENSHGEMVEYTKVNIQMIRRKDLGFSYGQMVVDMRASGSMDVNMAKGNIILLREDVVKANGRMARELPGQILINSKHKMVIINICNILYTT